MTGADVDRSVQRVVWAVTAAAVALFWLVSTSWRPWDLFAVGGFSADFYDEQARVLLRGRLAVDPSVPGPEGFLVDGKTYLYYGPFLALVRLPFALFGDLFSARLVRVSMLVALVVLCRSSARLALAARSMRTADRTAAEPETHDHVPDRSSWTVGLVVAAVAFSPALFAAGWTSVYHETELWALALAVLSASFIVRWAASGFGDTRLLVGAGLSALATTLTRAPIGFGMAFAIGVCGIVLLLRGRMDREERRIGLAALGFGLAPLVAHALVNVAKFGTWLSVPGDRQVLTINSPVRAEFFESTGGSFFSIQFLPTTVVHYLRPDTIRFERLVPGIRFGPLAVDRGGLDVETVTPASSLIASATLLVVLAVVGGIWILRRRALAWGLVVLGGVLGAIPTFLIGFVANRYLIDMLPPLVVAGAVGAWSVSARAASRSIRVAAVVLVVWGAWVNASLATWTLEAKTVGFTELRVRVDDAVFGGGHPSFVTLVPGTPVPRDGVVASAEDCSGVWISEQGRWVALQRADGFREISAVTIGGRTVVARTDAWTVEVDSDEGTFSVLDPAGAVRFEREVPIDGPTPVRVVADEVMGTFEGHVGEASFFLPADLMSEGGPDLRVDRGDREGDVPLSPLCRRITS